MIQKIIHCYYAFILEDQFNLRIGTQNERKKDRLKLRLRWKFLHSSMNEDS